MVPSLEGVANQINRLKLELGLEKQLMLQYKVCVFGVERLYLEGEEVG